MTFKEVLNKYRAISFTEKEKGTKFERLMRSWLLTDPSLEYELDDFNGGKFPFLPKQYKYLNLAVGYSQNRDTAIVEIEKITFTPDMIRAKMFCYWIEEFHISRVAEVHRKK